MTTGRINQVAFLGDNTTRRSPSLKIPAARPRRARKSILSSTSRAKSGRGGGGRGFTLRISRGDRRGRFNKSAQAERRRAGLPAPGENEARGHLHI
ncbi:hypothetical protein SADUNF_Sadunf19G0059700 [Salix dunnii]|uniref:Uncharacterized protein n=1 Tax=Salix dunnii TaxID=1413687 RepID=A0A835MHR7_9ROSI|nr:hypothetical protein SADUNF_Sadunf19G0059700 [Salix dunnii]